jgi:hypothetical protein
LKALETQMNNLFRSNLWDQVAAELGYPRDYIKRQFYMGIYDRIRTPTQELIVTTVLKLKSPLSYKAETTNNKKRGSYGTIRQSGIKETKPLS